MMIAHFLAQQFPGKEATEIYYLELNYTKNETKGKIKSTFQMISGLINMNRKVA